MSPLKQLVKSENTAIKAQGDERNTAFIIINSHQRMARTRWIYWCSER